jgi:putrescine transport system substrate-binding protein
MSTRIRPVLNLMAAALAAASGVALAQPAEPKVLNVYNWSDYIAEDTIKNFEKETGIKVRYDNYDNNEILQAKLIAGKTGYDIVVPSAHFAKTQIQGGLYQKLDRAQLSNWGNLDPALLEKLSGIDPGNEHLVTWLWGYVTVGINTGKVKAALGAMPLPANPWDLIFKPEYAASSRAAASTCSTRPAEVMPVAMIQAGKEPYSKVAKDYDAARDVLKARGPS